MENPRAAVAVPLSTFGGLITELTASDIPMGGSPDNQDVAFAPGGFQTRPGMARVYTNPPSSAAIVYQKTFTRNDGTVFNVLLDADGALWGENRTAPGVFTNFANVPAGSLGKFLDANGRLYMCFNDGLRGTNVPLQWDGTYLDRVTQDGPGVGPAMANYGLPATTMAPAAGVITPATISTCASTGPITITRFNEQQTFFTTVTFNTTAPHGFITGQSLSLSGVSWSGLGQDKLPTLVAISSVPTPTSFVIYYTTQNSEFGSGGTATPTSAAGITAVRLNSVVTVSTTSAHGLNVGNFVRISGMANNTIGGGISAIARVSNETTVTTSSDHGLLPNSIVAIAGVADTTYNGPEITVLAVLSSTKFTYENNGTDGSSTGGTVSDLWNGLFPVTAVQGSQQFSYSQIGANDSTTSVGTVTPNGQLTPGVHNCVCIFQTRTGFLTAPSAPVSYTANGGQYLQVTNIPIGPSNVVARILAFTLAGGSKYFYIPVTVTINGIVTALSTVINDNSTTATILDISDDSLAGAAGIDIPGNNLFRLRTLGNCSGVYQYASRTLWQGDDNKIVNFLNPGFDGGYVGTPTVPTGWNLGASPTGSTSLVPSLTGASGYAVQLTSAGGAMDALLWQGAYQDAYGATIIPTNTKLSVRMLASLSDSVNITGLLIVDLYSPSLGGVVLGGNVQVSELTSDPQWISFPMGSVGGLYTPASLPSDLQVRIYLAHVGIRIGVTIDEWAIFFSDKPFNDTQLEASYVANPESVDGLTGNFGATADPTPIMDCGRLKDNFYWVTQSTLQTTKDQQSAEPGAWDVNEMGAKCGGVSLNCMITGESWLGWAGLDGVWMWDGSNPVKITQEVQAKWDALATSSLNRIIGLNDSISRRMYFAVPRGSETAPAHVYVIDYRFANTGADIEDRGAVRVSPYNGKMLVLELSRKFTEWTIPAVSVGVLNTDDGNVPAFGTASGQVYTLDPAKFSDDDYGTIPWYYITSPFAASDDETQFGVGNFRHLYTYLTSRISTLVGSITFTPYVGNLGTAWPARGPYTFASASPSVSLETGLNVSGEKMFLKISGSPLDGQTDSFANVSQVTVTMKPHPYSPVAK